MGAALERLKSLIEDETSTTELLTEVWNKNRAEWTKDSPLVTAVKFKRRDIIEALVNGGLNINSTVKNHLVSSCDLVIVPEFSSSCCTFECSEFTE